MTLASKYNPQVAWRFIVQDIFQLTKETSLLPATYRMTCIVVDTQEPGAGQKDVGYTLIDYGGNPYSIIAVATNTIDVSDDFRTGGCPTSGHCAIICKSVFNGRALYVSPESFRHLHPLAMDNLHKYEMALLWANDPNVKKIPFTGSSFPKIINYQSDQVDPEDATKTLNYAEDYGENPAIRLVITVDTLNRYQQQQMVLFTYVDGKIDTAGFDLGAPFDCYILISRA